MSLNENQEKGQKKKLEIAARERQERENLHAAEDATEVRECKLK